MGGVGSQICTWNAHVILRHPPVNLPTPTPQCGVQFPTMAPCILWSHIYRLTMYTHIVVNTAITKITS